MKKLITMIILLSLLLVGCSKQAELEATNLPFTQYLDQLLIDSLEPTDIAINFSFIDPESFGINPEPYDLGFTTQEEFNEYFDEVKQIIVDLKSYKDEDLNDQQRLDRDALLADFEMSLGSKDFYEFEIGSNVLGFSRAFSGNVPAYLETYDFHNERDVIGYLNFLETLEGSYAQYLELEKNRQKSGRGYGQQELDKIIDQAQESADAMKDPGYFLIDDFKKKIVGLNLSDESYYVEKQQKLMNENMSDAYQLIVDELSSIKAEDTTGLVNKPGGKDYYLYLLQSNTGSSRSIKEIRAFIKKKKAEIMMNLSSIAQTTDSNELFKRLQTNEFGSFTDGYELMSFIERELKDDFPEITPVNYELRKVHPSMEKASSPAFYFTPYTDYSPEYLQSIYINGDFDNRLYQTYAHEGMPGHMYQFNYFLELGMHPIRSLYTQSSNAEGWANYVESIAHSYVEEDQTYVQFAKNYNDITQILHIEMDLGVNYDGWSKEKFASFFVENFGNYSEAEITDFYLRFTHNPSVYPTYYLSNLYITDMKEQVMKAKGNAYSEKEFHEVFLRSGSVGFDLIQLQVDRYLEDSE